MSEVKIETWDSEEGEAAMQEGHEPSWQALVDNIQEKNLLDKTILDFGCNRGEFLRFLNRQSPFKAGLGVDIAVESLKEAQAQNTNDHIQYEHNDALKSKDEYFDIAFSHEVIYLLPDLEAHAQEINRVLKCGGIYYLAIGEYEENPLWERWKKIVSEFSPVPPQTYSLQDIARNFQMNGFEIEVKRMPYYGFIPYNAFGDRYIENPMEMIEFMTEYMILFRMKKIG